MMLFLSHAIGAALGGIVRAMLTALEQVDLMAKVAHAGDRAAFATLLRHFAPRVKAYLLRGRANASQVDEVVQEVMLTVWSRAGAYNADQASVGTWVYTIARNRWIDRVRKERRPAPEEDDPAWVPSAPEAPDAAVDKQREQARVAAAMAALPEEQAQIIRSAYFEGKAQQAIAKELGVPIGTVKSRVRLAMKRLKKELAHGASSPSP